LLKVFDTISALPSFDENNGSTSITKKQMGIYTFNSYN
jgi:hypothetical protein